MKTYIINIPNEIKLKSQTLDVKTILTKTSWDVVTDDGTKQSFIFKKNQDLFISNNGDVVKGTWEYFPMGRNIMFTISEQMSLFNPMLINGIIVLQKDGTDECIFLTDKNSPQYAQATIESIEALIISLALAETPTTPKPQSKPKIYTKRKLAFQPNE